MTTMIAEVYDALISAGASDDKARAASKALSDYVDRFSKVEGELLLLKWMGGFNIALSVGILMLLLKH